MKYFTQHREKSILPLLMGKSPRTSSILWRPKYLYDDDKKRATWRGRGKEMSFNDFLYFGKPCGTSWREGHPIPGLCTDTWYRHRHMKLAGWPSNPGPETPLDDLRTTRLMDHKAGLQTFLAPQTFLTVHITQYMVFGPMWLAFRPHSYSSN